MHMKLTPRLERAICVSANAHREQVRKVSNIPYIIHPYSVMLLASEDTTDEDTLIACLFHDILEDVPENYSATDMEDEFGSRVVSIVRDVTKDDSIDDWHQRSEAYLHHLETKGSDEAILVCLADKCHNLLSTLSDFQKDKDAVWSRFTGSAKDQLWWYTSVQKITKKRCPSLVLHARLDDYIAQLRQIVK